MLNSSHHLREQDDEDIVEATLRRLHVSADDLF
jgi:hypothetical protein